MKIHKIFAKILRIPEDPQKFYSNPKNPIQIQRIFEKIPRIPKNLQEIH